MIDRIKLMVVALLVGANTASAYNVEHVQRLQKTGHCEGCDLTGLRYVPDFKPKSPPSISDISHANITSDLAKANLKKADLSGAELSGLNLEDAILTGATLVKARLVDSNLKNANLQGANLAGAMLTNADLSNANLIDALLSGTIFVGANLSKARFGTVNESTWEDFSWGFKTRDSLTIFSFADLSGARYFPDDHWVEPSSRYSWHCNTRMPSGIRVRYEC